MRKFELYTVTSGHRHKSPVKANGFREADQKAREIYAKTYPDYPCNDTYIECVESQFNLEYDHLILQKDCFGDTYWRKMMYFDGLPMYIKLLDDDEEQELQEWLAEVELHVKDLNEVALKELYHQVAFGSLYLSDYQNDWHIDESEVSDVCEWYEKWCREENIADTDENFARYVTDVL